MLSGSLIRREYRDFRGVDFGNDPGMVDFTRSPDALNVWKNYESDVTCIQTRPGYKKVAEIGSNINGFFVYSSSKAIVHSGMNLFSWNNFPATPTASNITILSTTMNNAESTMCLLNSKTNQQSTINDTCRLYINDGLNYLVYDATNGLKTVASEAYVPTTSISRAPRGGGKINEDVNLLTGKRINTFCGDGTSTSYYLDAENIDSVEAVYVNGVLQTPREGTTPNDYYANYELGTIEFTTAPSTPALLGQDNVEVRFTKTTLGYENRIKNCKIAVPFDNRIFFSGNSTYPNVFFHSSLDNPAYCSDLDYYEEGTTAEIKDLVVGQNELYVLKNSNQDEDAIFYHTPATDAEYGRIYARHQSKVSTGCYVKGCNFRDTIVYLSRSGLEGIDRNLALEHALVHKSTNVDKKMASNSNFKYAKMIEWNDYLVIAINSEIFLADSRQLFAGKTGTEYEWFYWQVSGNIKNLHVYNNNLYFGTDDGSIFMFGGLNDNGVAILSYWVTPMDQTQYPEYRKTTNKRGTIAKIKNLQNGKIKIYVKTDRKSWKLLKELSSVGFDYSNVDYANFSYATGDNYYATFRVKQKKIKHISFKFECNELNKSFGIYRINTSMYLGSFVK